MVHFKLLLNNKRAKQDKIYPIEVRVTYNRNNTTFSTGVKVNESYWDDINHRISSAHPNAQTFNHSISKLYAVLQDIAYRLINDNQFTFENLREKFNSIDKPVVVKITLTFKEFTNKLIEDMYNANETGNATIYQTASNRIIIFADNQQLKFTDIDYTFLEAFKRQLVKECIRVNSISNYLRTIRAIYNKAIKAKLVERSYYPFLDISIKTEPTAKRALRIFDIIKIGEVHLKPIHLCGTLETISCSVSH